MSSSNKARIFSIKRKKIPTYSLLEIHSCNVLKSPSSIPVLYDISVLKTQIQNELCVVLKSGTDDLEDNISDVRYIRELQESLTAMEHTLIEYPITKLVGLILEK
jgi:hypothetical protein